MATREVPSYQWSTFFDEYTRTHQGQPVTLTMLDAGIGAQEETKGLPFVGVSTDRKDGEPRVFVMVGDQPTGHLTHSIMNPVHIRIRQAEGEAPDTIEIEAADGARTLVCFAA